ncbi:TetR/AcrR family transcriptional regulator [Microbacterium sp. W1N]|uniref:TetR/AcrR family transcriptional regulator n=1 Tax=Microbacterium festucae TaxID=2977531 RepID=UPI0021C15EBA|nr:TetR/AcrR family transcriptional regulator [Microbacterium festucae]MCT9819258.1 TetR/AcrR family transcriptional regulator [Microbacterium festucae]
MTTATRAEPTRSARVAQTRARILAAAQTLFVERGYRATSLRDIAAEAEISHPGLLKHFSSKDALLAAVVSSFEAENEAVLASTLPSGSSTDLPFRMVAERNQRVPGYLELFAALSGEACAHGHPAHAPMAARYARLRAQSSAAMAEYIAAGAVAAGRDPLGESVRMAAAWDGLQVISLYLPERVRVPDALARHEQRLREPAGRRPAPRATASAPAPLPDVRTALVAGRDEDAGGYRVGRERRARILEDAMALFARDGYTDTSLREIAAAVGVSKSTLLHHYPSKEELLAAVLVERDARIADTVPVTAVTAAGLLRELPSGAAANAAVAPGLIEVYAVLTCEAIPADHPAHDYFRQRYERTIDEFAGVFRAAQLDGALAADRDPEFEAIWLVALWDGLQYQWLYDSDAVDVAEHLTAHLADILP